MVSLSSSIIHSIEARTALHNLVSPCLIIFCLFCLTSVIKFIPNACLSAIVIVNLFSLFAQFGDLKKCWKTSWADFGCFVVCAVCTICFGTEAGLIGGISSSLIFLLINVLMIKPSSFILVFLIL